MKRLADAFTTPNPNNESSSRLSPLETTLTSLSDGAHRPPHRSYSPSPQRSIYDDPRQTRHYTTSSSSWSHTQNLSVDNLYPGSRDARGRMGPIAPVARRPGLLRTHTDEGISRSQSATPTARYRDASESGTKEAGRKGVKVNVLAGASKEQRGWGMSTLPGSGRVTAMVAGPEGRYAVGGGQYLRVLQISPEGSESTTPTGPPPTPLAKGPGGATIVELANLWKGQWGVSKGVNDLDWGVGQFSSKIVSACPSGNILIFDVTRGKQEKEVSGGHPRPMNVTRLCKTPSHGHLLITGGTEGQAKLWDLREREPTIRKYFKHSVPITALTFAPESPHYFLVGLENGSIQRYDLRHQHKPIGRVWGAHGNKPVMDLRWKDGIDGGWLASAGTDRTVQIWDMSNNWERPPTPLHVLHTPYPLRRVAWRPNHDTELAIVPLTNSLSASMTSLDPSISSIPQGLGSHPTTNDTDAHIEIWDVRRHHISKYTVPTQEGPSVGLNFVDQNTFVAAFQNGTFAQVDLDQREMEKRLPLDTIPRQVMCWNIRGDMVFGLDRFKSGEIPFDDPKPEYSSHWDKVGQKLKGIGDPAYAPLQTVGILPFPEREEDDFAYLAVHYKVEGAAPELLCQWNCDIAALAGRMDDARLWTLLKSLIEEFAPSSDAKHFDEGIFGDTILQMEKRTSPTDISPRGSLAKPQPPASPHSIPLERLEDALDDTEETLLSSSSASSGSSTSDSSSDAGSATPMRSKFFAFAPPDPKRVVDIQSTSRAVSSSRQVSSSYRATPNALLAQSLSQASKVPLDRSAKSRESRGSTSMEADYPDPYGVINSYTPPPPSTTASNSTSRLVSRGVGEWPDPYGIGHRSAETSARVSPMTSHKPSPKLAPEMKNVKTPLRDWTLSGGSGSSENRQKDYTDSEWAAYKAKRCQALLDWWQCYVNDGEVQMATVVYIIGACVVDFPRHQCERIAHSYVDMLDAHRLAIPAAYMRRHALMPSLEVRPTDEGMTHVVTCEKCKRSTGAVDIPLAEGTFWWCKRCKAAARRCVICHRAAKGLWLGCGACKHGGHHGCMVNYFATAQLRTTPSNQQEQTRRPPLTRQQSPAGLRRNQSVHPGQSGLSGFSTSSLPGTSHESSGYVDRSTRTSGETDRNEGALDDGDGRYVQKWNACPQGCGCHCRTVMAPREAREGQDNPATG